MYILDLNNEMSISNNDYNAEEALNIILKQIKKNFSSEDRQDIYIKPQIIYRGIYKDYENNTDTNNDWYIRSSLAVRLRESYKDDKNREIYKEVNKSEYLEYLSDIIDKLKKRYPEKYNRASDLMILADMQHNGCATCLVDFSKNLLTSLWFACSNEFDSDGYLFCYNIMEDVIYNNCLSIINKTESTKNIRELLLKTYRFVDACSIVTNKFCLWDPDNVNGRISRQDSVFVFGIEPFNASKMSGQTMMQIIIPAKLKMEICVLLDSMFCINSTTIYNDTIGFASSNSKTITLPDSHKEMKGRLYSKGYDAMLGGNYKEALQLFNGIEVGDNKVLSIEINFSLGVCYKNISKDYHRNAIISYQRVIEQAKELLNTNDYEYYVRKVLRAYNEIIELCYSTNDFIKGMDFCDEAETFMNDISSNNNPKFQSLKTEHCKLSKLEFSILCLLKSSQYTIDELKIRAIYRDILKHEKSNFNTVSFLYILAKFYKCVYKIYIANIDKHNRETTKTLVNKYLCLFKNFLNINNECINYFDWNFEDLLKVIESSDCCDSTIAYIKELISYMISHRNILQCKNDIFPWMRVSKDTGKASEI